MADDTPTPTGGETGHTVQSAAKAISGILDAQEPPKDQETPTPEAPAPTQDGQQETEAKGDEGTSEPENDAQNEATLETLDQLAEATGLSIETILNLKAKAKVDGTESSVPLAEVLKSYQLSKHVNSESQELANQRKAFEADREKQVQEMQHRLTEAQALSQALEQSLLAEYNSIDWNTLRTTDPAEFAAKKQEYNDRYHSVQGMKHRALTEAYKLQQEHQEKEATRIKELIKSESQKLLDAIPEWKDATKAKTEKDEIKNYLLAMGFSEQDTGSLIDHRQVKIIRNAMLYEKSSKKATLEQKKVVNLPKVLKPGAQTSKQDASRERIKESMSKLRKSGDLKDAAAAIKNFI